MSLRVKVALQVVIMLVGALLISATAIWSINGMEQDYDVALTGYDELREVYGSVGSHMMMAQESLATPPGDRDRALYHLQNARDRFELYRASFKQFPRMSPHDPEAEEAIHAALTRALDAARSGNTDAGDRAEADAIQTAMVQTGMFASRVLLLTDGESAVPVRIPRNAIAALITGRGDGSLEIRGLAAGGLPFRRGDVAVTSGTGGVYAPNIPVAVVTAVRGDRAIAFPLADPALADFAVVYPIYQPPVEERPAQPKP